MKSKLNYILFEVPDTSKPCQCNTACAEYGDCCSDYEEVCNSGGGGEGGTGQSAAPNQKNWRYKRENSLMCYFNLALTPRCVGRAAEGDIRAALRAGSDFRGGKLVRDRRAGQHIIGELLRQRPAAVSTMHL